jgi:hypothetical protein
MYGRCEVAPRGTRGSVRRRRGIHPPQELRFPAFGEFDLGVFFEAGNLWLDTEQYRPASFATWQAPAFATARRSGAIAFDLGVNLVPDVQINEPGANLHFSIGLF